MIVHYISSVHLHKDPWKYCHSAGFTDEVIETRKDSMTHQGLPSSKSASWALNPEHCGFKPGPLHPGKVNQNPTVTGQNQKNFNAAASSISIFSSPKLVLTSRLLFLEL